MIQRLSMNSISFGEDKYKSARDSYDELVANNQEIAKRQTAIVMPPTPPKPKHAGKKLDRTA